MKTVKLLSVAAGLASLCFTASCAEEQESSIINGAAIIEDGCTVTVPAMQYYSRGRLDLSFGTAYNVSLEISNQLAPQSAMTTNNAIDNSEVQITGLDVVLSSDQRPDVIDMLAEEQDGALIDFSPAVPTNSLGGGDLLGMGVVAIPAATAARLAEVRIGEARRAGEAAAADFMAANPGATPEEIAAATAAGQNAVLFQGETYIAAVTVRARRTGNNVGSVGEFEAREFRFPIEVCWGCTLSCQTCEQMVDLDGDGTDETVTGVCPSGFDVSIDAPVVNPSQWVGLSTSCIGGQDDVFVPASCGQ
ncbi:MAG: hypothetical protein ACE37F_34140 [Nannocystaceae bacterium]|nr:hypothetical protein [bacterium]